MAKPRFYPVILAGGRGTRFWPRSRKKLAKQVLALDGEQTMIQQTVARLAPLAPAERFWVITNGDLSGVIARQLRTVPKQQIVAEPAQRNTAPAIGLAATKEKTHAGKVRAHGSELVDSPCFHIDKLSLRRSDTWAPATGHGDSPRIIVALEGSGRLEARGHEAVAIHRGEAVVIPASVGEFALHPLWQIDFLAMSLPAGKTQHPETTLVEKAATR